MWGLFLTKKIHIPKVLKDQFDSKPHHRNLFRCIFMFSFPSWLLNWLKIVMTRIVFNGWNAMFCLRFLHRRSLVNNLHMRKTNCKQASSGESHFCIKLRIRIQLWLRLQTVRGVMGYRSNGVGLQFKKGINLNHTSSSEKYWYLYFSRTLIFG